jgi:hypothetical protein
LTEAKARCGHGNWLPWLKREFDWSERTARHFAGVYEMSKMENFADLESLEISALYLLAAPSTPEFLRDDVAARVRAGEAPTLSDIRHAVRPPEFHRLRSPPNRGAPRGVRCHPRASWSHGGGIARRQINHPSGRSAELEADRFAAARSALGDAGIFRRSELRAVNSAAMILWMPATSIARGGCGSARSRTGGGRMPPDLSTGDRQQRFAQLKLMVRDAWVRRSRNMGLRIGLSFTHLATGTEVRLFDGMTNPGVRLPAGL